MGADWVRKAFRESATSQMRPSTSFGSLRSQSSFGGMGVPWDTWTLATSPSYVSLAQLELHNPDHHAQKVSRIRRLNEQADVRLNFIQKHAAESASRASLMRRRPNSALTTPGLQMMPSMARISPKDYIFAPRFAGIRQGYTHKIGVKGAGYYRNPVSAKGSSSPSIAQLEAQLSATTAKPINGPPIKALTHEEKFQQEKELKQIMSMAEEGLNSRFSNMYKAFQAVDLDHSGRLSREEILRAMDLWNIPMDDHKLDLLLGDCDQDGDGGVSYEEFVDKLARGTVSVAAMGKRGMQSKEAMGVDSQEMLAEQLGHKKLAKFRPTVNG